MKRILFVRMFLTRILPFHGGQAPQKNGGNFVHPMIGGWVAMSGQVLITAASLHLTNGPISILISGSWTCVDFLKIFITTINHGGQTRMYYTFRRTGTGRAKKENRSMCG